MKSVLVIVTSPADWRIATAPPVLETVLFSKIHPSINNDLVLSISIAPPWVLPHLVKLESFIITLLQFVAKIAPPEAV